MSNQSKPKVRIGIDLGTCNSCCYMIKNGVNAIGVDNPDGSYLLPSIIRYFNDKMIVGNPAKKELKNGKPCIVKSSKRLIGRRFECPDVQAIYKDCGSTVIDDSGYPVFDINELGMRKTPVDVAVDLLKTIITQAELKSDGIISDICITIPAHFDSNQRTATEMALKKCGFNNDHIEIINEPTAAAIAFLIENKKKNSRILVYDLGGGTVDVSIVNIVSGCISIETYEGDNALGGICFDAEVANWIEKEFLKGTEKNLHDCLSDKRKKTYRQMLLSIAEEAKISLSTIPEFEIDLEILGQEQTYMMSEETLNQLITPYIDKSMTIVKKALKNLNYTKNDIDNIVVIGGSTRIPLVHTKLKEIFGDRISQAVNPDEGVAKGACLKHLTDFVVADRLGTSLGHMITGNRIQCIIPQNSSLPAKETVRSTTASDYQDVVITFLYQGNSEKKGDVCDARLCTELEKFIYDGFEIEEKGMVHFDTAFSIEESGIVNVTVIEVETNKVLLNKKIEWNGM